MVLYMRRIRVKKKKSLVKERKRGTLGKKAIEITSTVSKPRSLPPSAEAVAKSDLLDTLIATRPLAGLVVHQLV